VNELPEPTWRMLLGRGLPNVALEGFLPILVFYAFWREAGLAAGVLASAIAAGVVVLVQLRRGLDVALAAAAGVFIVIQATVALVTHSETVYLAQPVLLSAAWGIAYFVSAAIGKPLIGAFARGFYPFPPEIRESELYRREFGMQSVVWGVFCLARAALRLWVLLASGVGGLLVVSFVTGTPLLIALVLWGVWHARIAFSRFQPADAVA
jgi:intracellular septation protein A